MGKTINGVLCPIDSDELGFTLIHEHFGCTDWSMKTAYGEAWIETDICITQVTENIRNAMKYSLKTFVDQTAVNMGRDVRLFREVAKQTGCQIIASTGLYYNEEPWLRRKDPSYIAEFFIRDITEGMQGTDSKAGMVKAGTDSYDFSPINLIALEACAIAAAKTQVPIMTHTTASRRHGLRQLEIFDKAGVDPKRVVIGHSGDTDDIEYLTTVVKSGAYLGMDRFALEIVFPEEKRINTVVKLVEKGYTEHILLSTDTNVFCDWGTHYWPAERNWTLEDHECFTHIQKNVIPELLKRGVSQQEIDTMMIENPRRLFGY